VGDCQGTGKHGCSAGGRRPRLRICLRKGCGRKYQPPSWNQRYYRDPECQRQTSLLAGGASLDKREIKDVLEYQQSGTKDVCFVVSIL
jgi:hypothetical protein